MAAEELGDMTTEDDQVRDTIRKNGTIPPLVRLLDSTVCVSLWLTASLCSHKKENIGSQIGTDDMLCFSQLGGTRIRKSTTCIHGCRYHTSIVASSQG